jgi:uncharacterized protein YpuA (DUF1002 family)
MRKTEILPKDIWNEEKLNNVNEFIKNHSDNQSKERKIKNKLLSIQYKLEDYIEKDDIKEIISNYKSHVSNSLISIAFVFFLSFPDLVFPL